MCKIKKDGDTVSDKKLNNRQKLFAEYYAQGNSAAESARKAGYSERFAAQNADKLLKNTNISVYVKELSDKLKDERIMTAKDRQVTLSDIARDNENEPSDRIKAIDTLNKMTGEYTVKVDTTVKTSGKLADIFAQVGGEGLDE